MDRLNNNPFVGLFPSLNQAQQFKSNLESSRLDSVECVSNQPEKLKYPLDIEPSSLQHASQQILNDDASVREDGLVRRMLAISAMIEDIFRITVEKDASVPCVFLEDFGSVLDITNLDQAVFERLMLDKASMSLAMNSATQNVKPKGRMSLLKEEATEMCAIRYLFRCFCRLISNKGKHKCVGEADFARCGEVIVSHARVALTHPEIFSEQSPHKQLLELIQESGEDAFFVDFFIATVSAIEMAHEKEDELSIPEVFNPVLDMISIDIMTPSVIDSRITVTIRVLQFFARRESLARTFIAYKIPLGTKPVSDVERSLLFTLLSISPLAKSSQGNHEFFETPSRFSQVEHENTDRIIWMSLSNMSNEIYQLLYNMLRLSTEVRHEVLSWIGNVLHSYSARTKLWNMHMNGMLGLGQAGDGFLLNLGSIFLRLCRPFSKPNSAKLLHVDPRYCSSLENDGKAPYLRGIDQETCLISLESGDRPVFSSFGFSSVCFFITHQSLRLGFQVVHERLVKLVAELRRLQRVYADIVQQGGESSEPSSNIKDAIEQGTTMYLCARAHMLEPETLTMMLDFHVATAAWLVNVSLNEDLTSFHEICFPLSDNVPKVLACVPEFVVDNIADFVSFLRRFSARTLEMAGGKLDHLMTMVLVFMGSPERLKNPHLRAKLVEILEGLIPHPEESAAATAIVPVYDRERLFCNHPHVSHLAATLLHVFVSIEMTGQSVAFEQKFNYRRPMYDVLDYLWKLDLHRDAIKKLSVEAEENIECPNRPLFLLFINLLINDAIYLLDEGLMHMSSLREHQRRRDSEEFHKLSASQRQEAEANVRHTGMLARFHNVMGKQTIHSLRLITSEVVSIFVHPTIVERIAAMLNYFLLHLVGPKNRTLKVRDMDEYEFKPQDLVTGICHIYINLGKSDTFCQAVALDGRSYSAELFVKAEDILCKIGQAALLPNFQFVALRVKDAAYRLRVEEEALVDAPDEFLDPIMGTLMRDPVIMPSSNVTVDRSTIARHLLSDQSDPFNRSPLSMDMVKPNVELKEVIDRWLQTKSQM